MKPYHAVRIRLHANIAHRAPRFMLLHVTRLMHHPRIRAGAVDDKLAALTSLKHRTGALGALKAPSMIPRPVLNRTLAKPSNVPIARPHPRHREPSLDAAVSAVAGPALAFASSSAWYRRASASSSAVAASRAVGRKNPSSSAADADARSSSSAAIARASAASS
eukprot:CAMPEP_0174586226 /NCGR_PEP_ID=MMETSP0929-20130131/25529_1 /TAXON_ID=548131 ORGANISM="Ostreococcus mediterraneus, Strain clade-D-RCC2572" /NCGR_SAMPLE_ID=MMETSP0929 /ASSEMBLY_ACC=CAM_ASM_000573 /LENGTH=163 /DNA_ID=CAMNT_0015768227 /DNA_START=829 /DNA_END=1317 /DNA_ORIENTATION=-